MLTFESPGSFFPLTARPLLFLPHIRSRARVCSQGTVIAEKVNWVGCQGSEPHFRGFPCSLWILFHFLTVQAARHNFDPSQETGEPKACAPCPARPGPPQASCHRPRGS